VNHLPEPEHPPIALGMTSLVLGTIGALLFFLPILGAPLSGLGLIAGVMGWIAAAVWGADNLRWAVIGTMVCAGALAINVAIYYAPTGYIEQRNAPPIMKVPGRPYVPPPARFQG
jgi:predicted membrane-bound spermidine synthase